MQDLADRMKDYEYVSRVYLTKRTPVIIRVDGRAFHTYTRGREKPFDLGLIANFRYAMKKTAEEMQGFKMAYHQSDEISFLITDYDYLETEPWFANNLIKLVSVTASLVTKYFNMQESSENPATFDARAFNIPKEEITNYFLWRAKDWRRNSISMLARSHFSHKELFGKSRDVVLEMLEDVDPWKNYEVSLKYGTFLVNGVFTSTQPTYSCINKLVPKECYE